jgi:hypothetical protein
MVMFSDIKNFSCWKIATDSGINFWRITCAPRYYTPPIFPKRLHRRLKIGSLVKLVECQLVFVEPSDQKRIGGRSFLVQEGDEQGLAEGIEWTLRTFDSFSAPILDTGLFPLQAPRVLSKTLSRHFANALWPERPQKRHNSLLTFLKGLFGG